MLRLGCAVGVLLAVGCVPAGDDELVFSIEQALATSPQGAAFADVVPAQWDRLCVFTRYSTLAQVDSVTGAVTAGERSAQLDTYTLLAFMDGSRPAARVEYPREKGDFGAPGPAPWYCVDRDAAVFQLRHPIEGGIPWIGPVEGSR
jgi:hypothetical protein